MLRFLHDIARSAASYFHPGGPGIDDGRLPGTHSPGQAYIQEYTDKYSAKVLRGMTRQRFGVDAWETIQETQQKAHRFVMENQPVEELQSLLQCCPHVAEVINIRDMLGYNLLQYAIISNRVDVVRFLILQGADLNLPICTRPLHLAAKLGHVKIIQLLLDCGADPDVVSCVCYPESHILQRTMFVSDSECWSVACFGDIYAQDKVFRVQFEYPLYYAIMSDSIDCVLLLMNRGANQLSSRSPKLHTACCFGAFQCVKYFLKMNPSDLSLGDHKGMFPLQYAVQWGKRFTEYLVLKGALVTVKTSYRESLLMLLYNQSRFIPGLAETSSYLLDCGLKMTVNAVDAGGNSPLHAIFKKLQKNPPMWIKPSPKQDMEGGDESGRSLCESFSGTCRKVGDVTACKSKIKSKHIVGSCSAGFYRDVILSSEEKEYFDSVVILLRAGANTNVANKVGSTCLHELLKIQIPDPLKASSPRGPHHCSLRLVYSLLSVLFEHGANPRFINNMHATIHGCLITTGTVAIFHQDTSEPLSIADTTELEYFIKSIWLLREHGCYFGTSCATEPLQHVLAKLDFLERLETHHDLTPQGKSDLAVTFTRQVMSVLEAMLCCGVHPTDIQAVYYQLVNHYPPLPVSLITQSVLLFLHHGADPNTGGIHIPMSVFRSRSLYSHCPVYPLLHMLNIMGKASSDGGKATSERDGGKAFSKCDEDKGFSQCDEGLLELFDVLYHAMDERSAKQCMFHYLCYDSNNGQEKDIPKALQTQVHAIMTTPKTLRQISAQFVYVKLCHRLKANVNHLPLPNTLKKILLSMQY